MPCPTHPAALTAACWRRLGWDRAGFHIGQALQLASSNLTALTGLRQRLHTSSFIHRHAFIRGCPVERAAWGALSPLPGGKCRRHCWHGAPGQVGQGPPGSESAAAHACPRPRRGQAPAPCGAGAAAGTSSLATGISGPGQLRLHCWTRPSHSDSLDQLRHTRLVEVISLLLVHTTGLDPSLLVA